ncbi:hypothetical protein [Streptomyces albidoflavus]|uniref:hypothetical protein n=1 Tax=Streptomyces albidoflavus TaxID=1886 RepID=UPI0033E3B995
MRKTVDVTKEGRVNCASRTCTNDLPDGKRRYCSPRCRQAEYRRRVAAGQAVGTGGVSSTSEYLEVMAPHRIEITSRMRDLEQELELAHERARRSEYATYADIAARLVRLAEDFLVTAVAHDRAGGDRWEEVSYRTGMPESTIRSRYERGRGARTEPSSEGSAPQEVPRQVRPGEGRGEVEPRVAEAPGEALQGVEKGEPGGAGELFGIFDAHREAERWP